MAANTISKELSKSIITVSIFMIFIAAFAMTAHADSPSVSIAIPSDATVNTNYLISVILSDTTNGSASKSITLYAPAGSTINGGAQATVTTNASGQVGVNFKTSKTAGNCNIIAQYLGVNYTITVYVNPDVPYRLVLYQDHVFRLANGGSKANVIATVYDKYNNTIPGLAVNFNVDGTASSVTTDSIGNATKVVGPYSTTHNASVTATVNSLSLSTTVRFLDSNNLILNRYPSSNMPIGSYAEVEAIFYEVLGTTPATGVPLTFIAYDRDFGIITTYSGVTDSNGRLPFYFNMSPKVGNNTIYVSCGDIGGTLAKTVIAGEGGEVNEIDLTAIPGTPVYADGTSKYVLYMQAKDSGGNPVPNLQLSVIKNGNTNYTYYPDKTDTNGFAAISIPASNFVCNDNYTVMASYDDLANNTTVTVKSSIILRYIAGSPTSLIVVANPNAVANANITTPVGAPDVHTTDIIATVTDQWGHPLENQTVTITTNTTLGNISGPSSGKTQPSGEFTTNFTLSPTNYGNDTVIGVPVYAQSGGLSATTHVLYTNDSFLSIKTGINPKSNLSVGSIINVNITVRGIGWKIRGQSYDIALIMDSSGSMDWLSTMTYPTGTTPKTGTMAADGISHTVMTFHNDAKRDIEVMMSSSYRNYVNGSYYYSLTVVGPSNTGYGNTTYTGTRSSNENYVIITNAPAGDYTVSGKFTYATAGGTPQYNSMVLVDPKRLGDTSDLDAAAKVAARGFVDEMNDNQVSVIWFNSSYSHVVGKVWGVTGWHWEGSGASKHKVYEYGWVDVSVTEDSNVSIPLKTVDSANKTAINNAINSLNANGGTHIGAGIETAIAELTGPNSNKSNKKVAILLSDGYSQSPDDDIAQAYNAKAANISIYTIGMGMPDKDTLDRIASITGTNNMSLVLSADDLKHAYGDIAGELKKVVATNTSMHIISSSSVINGTLYPDTVYVPGSAVVKYPNGTSVSQDPAINSAGKYELIWNPGVIKLNDTWTVNYKLKVMDNGTIEPISNQSYTNYMREDGSNNTAMFMVEAIFIGGNSSDDLTGLQNLHVVITSPLNASHGMVAYNVTNPSQVIKWNVNYTGNYTYKQTLYIDGVQIADNYVGPSPTTVGNVTTDQYTIYASGLTLGNHVFKVVATEVISGVETGQKEDEILLNIAPGSGGSGRITLE